MDRLSCIRPISSADDTGDIGRLLCSQAGSLVRDGCWDTVMLNCESGDEAGAEAYADLAFLSRTCILSRLRWPGGC